ncbi:MAG: efflux RND transporter permease subunit [Gammaproteobacteria bacterium]|nr:efflux RND transporter permease subunit [Gammaproteobacteria bacterium]
MNLPEISVRRHVLAYMLSGVLVLFGVISFDRIGVDRNPEADFPMITVVTRLPGANPEIIDSSITNTIEKIVNGVAGIDHVESISAPDRSIVRVKFEMDKDIDVAFNEVQVKINQILPQLPEEADPPVVAKVEIGGTPVMWLTLSGDRTLQQLNVYAENEVKKRLETIAGVGEVRIGGERERTIRVELELERMAAFGVTVQDIQAAFRREHVRLPGGFLVGGTGEDLLKADLEFHDLESLAGMIVAHREGAPIRLGDVARIEDGVADFRVLARFNGEPTVGIGVVKVTGANTVEIVNEVKRRLESEIVPQLPAGVEIGIAHDEGELIGQIVAALEEHLVLGTLLTALVVLGFLRNLRATAIVSAAIPVSLLGAVAAIYFLGYTFNTMTLLGLLLLIGVVVDDAIVVLESIFRHGERTGADRLSATIEGAREVTMAVVAATLTLVSIFAPVIFMEGIVARMFEAFAVVVSVGVLASLLVSLTLTPMLCSRHLRLHSGEGAIARRLGGALDALERHYRRMVALTLRARWSVVLATVLAVASSLWLFGQIGKGFFPEMDEGYFSVTVKVPLGSSIEHAVDRLARVEDVLKRQPGIEAYFSTIGQGQAGQVSEASIVVHLRHWSEREASQQEIIERVDAEFANLAGVEAFPTPASMLGGMRGEPLHFVLVGPELDEVARQAYALRERLLQEGDLGKLDLDLQLALPQLELAVDRDQLAGAGLAGGDVAMALGVLAGGWDVADYNDVPGDGERYPIRLKAAEGELARAEDLSRIWLRTASGEMLRLDSVASLRRVVGPAVIARYDLQYAANFYTAPAIPEGVAGPRVLEIARAMMPTGYEVQLAGRAEEFQKTASYMLLTFVTALMLVYMVLASQFNSFVQPLIVMVAQPLAIVGGVFALWATGHTINVFSMIGLVLLVGLVAKNSILLIDLTNQLREQGRSIDAALTEACPIRMRPVLMTSMTIILAMLPAAIGVGAGSDTNGPLAVAVIGGMVSSTLLTLVVVPAVYSLVEHRLERRIRS